MFKRIWKFVKIIFWKVAKGGKVAPTPIVEKDSKKEEKAVIVQGMEEDPAVMEAPVRQISLRIASAPIPIPEAFGEEPLTRREEQRRRTLMLMRNDRLPPHQHHYRVYRASLQNDESLNSHEEMMEGLHMRPFQWFH